MQKSKEHFALHWTSYPFVSCHEGKGYWMLLLRASVSFAADFKLWLRPEDGGGEVHQVKRVWVSSCRHVLTPGSSLWLDHYIRLEGDFHYLEEVKNIGTLVRGYQYLDNNVILISIISELKKCQITYHPMKTYCGTEIQLGVLYRQTGWKWTVSFTPRSLYSWIKIFLYSSEQQAPRTICTGWRRESISCILCSVTTTDLLLLQLQDVQYAVGQTSRMTTCSVWVWNVIA